MDEEVEDLLEKLDEKIRDSDDIHYSEVVDRLESMAEWRGCVSKTVDDFIACKDCKQSYGDDLCYGANDDNYKVVYR